MAAIVLADVTDLCPDITRVSALWLSWVNSKVSVNDFDGEDGVHTKLVRCYLAAHFTTISDTLGGAAGGPVTSASEGGISRSFAVTDMSSDALNRTGYGSTALGLIRGYVPGVWIADGR